MDQTFDLFGDPVSANHGRRGRPQHIPTQENRNKVSMLLALGWNNERIAASLRITQPSLRKHYFSELKFRDVARDRLNAAMAMKLWAQVEAGNVSAMREFNGLLERNDIAVGHSEFYAGQRRDADAERDTIAPVGKKEIAAQAAETAGEGTPWGNDLKPH
jgi:hypothetical protein